MILNYYDFINEILNNDSYDDGDMLEEAVIAYDRGHFNKYVAEYTREGGYTGAYSLADNVLKKLKLKLDSTETSTETSLKGKFVSDSEEKDEIYVKIVPNTELANVERQFPGISQYKIDKDVYDNDVSQFIFLSNGDNIEYIEGGQLKKSKKDKTLPVIVVKCDNEGNDVSDTNFYIVKINILNKPNTLNMGDIGEGVYFATACYFFTNTITRNANVKDEEIIAGIKKIISELSFNGKIGKNLLAKYKASTDYNKNNINDNINGVLVLNANSAIFLQAFADSKYESKLADSDRKKLTKEKRNEFEKFIKNNIVFFKNQYSHIIYYCKKNDMLDHIGIISLGPIDAKDKKEDCTILIQPNKKINDNDIVKLFDFGVDISNEGNITDKSKDKFREKVQKLINFVDEHGKAKKMSLKAGSSQAGQQSFGKTDENGEVIKENMEQSILSFCKVFLSIDNNNFNDFSGKLKDKLEVNKNVRFDRIIANKVHSDGIIAFKTFMRGVLEDMREMLENTYKKDTDRLKLLATIFLKAAFANDISVKIFDMKSGIPRAFSKNTLYRFLENIKCSTTNNNIKIQIKNEDYIKFYYNDNNKEKELLSIRCRIDSDRGSFYVELGKDIKTLMYKLK